MPAGVACQRGYRAFRVRGPLPLDLIGILASIADPLAAVGVSIFAISTYDTDYVLVKEGDLDVAVGALNSGAPGHAIRENAFERWPDTGTPTKRRFPHHAEDFVAETSFAEQVATFNAALESIESRVASGRSHARRSPTSRAGG